MHIDAHVYSDGYTVLRCAEMFAMPGLTLDCDGVTTRSIGAVTSDHFCDQHMWCDRGRCCALSTLHWTQESVCCDPATPSKQSCLARAQCQSR